MFGDALEHHDITGTGTTYITTPVLHVHVAQFAFESNFLISDSLRTCVHIDSSQCRNVFCSFTI